MSRFTTSRWLGLLLLAAVISPALVGCRSSVDGSMQPAGHGYEDDVQYLPAGPEFVLEDNETALKKYQWAADETPASTIDDDPADDTTSR